MEDFELHKTLSDIEPQWVPVLMEKCFQKVFKRGWGLSSPSAPAPRLERWEAMGLLKEDNRLGHLWEKPELSYSSKKIAAAAAANDTNAYMHAHTNLEQLSGQDHMMIKRKLWITLIWAWACGWWPSAYKKGVSADTVVTSWPSYTFQWPLNVNTE